MRTLSRCPALPRDAKPTMSLGSTITATVQGEVPREPARGAPLGFAPSERVGSSRSGLPIGTRPCHRLGPASCTSRHGGSDTGSGPGVGEIPETGRLGPDRYPREGAVRG